MKQTNGFNPEQQCYLQGLAMGADVARKINGLPVLSNQGLPASIVQVGGMAPSEMGAERPLCSEQRAQRETSPGQVWDALRQRAADKQFPKGMDVFLQKHYGLFYVAPAQDAYMCRLRFPGGAVRSYQLSGVADLADRYAGGYADVTTRANLQLREIRAGDATNVLCGLRDLGICNTGAGGDNIRNITASPLSGIDCEELIETLPLAHELHHYILNHREFYGLPRKFNIAFDGGGAVSALEDTNDVGFRAVVLNPPHDTHQTPAGVYFELLLGGITGHRDFAKPETVVIQPWQCVPLAAACIRVFLEHGDRSDRKKARLKYLLDQWGHDRFLDEVAQRLPFPLVGVPPEHITPRHAESRLAHVGFHPQIQPGQWYVGVVLPVGRMTSDQLRGLANIAQRYGSQELRLTVWQNILVPNIAQDDLDDVADQLLALGLDWRASNVRAGLVACTGNAGCKYAAADTKGHAMMLADYIEQRLELDQPINLHLTGCHHSCAQHYIGDLGFLATSVEDGEQVCEGYHVYVGGGYGQRQGCARELFRDMRFLDIPPMVVRLLEAYQARRHDDESFHHFAARHPVNTLQSFCNATSLVH